MTDTDPTTGPTPAQQAKSIALLPPTDAVLAMTNYGREVYLIPCPSCACPIPARRADLSCGRWPDALARHQNFHASIGAPFQRDAWGLR